MHFKHLLMLLFSLLLTLFGYYYFLVKNPPTKNSKPTIVCTTTIIADAIKNIAGDTLNLKILMGPGVDPHTYKPIEQDIITILSADIIFYNGLHLEARMAELFENMQSKITTIAVTKNMPEQALIYSQQFHDYADPHVWFDPNLWILAVQTISQTLQEKYPDHAQLYKNNESLFISKIQATYKKTYKMMQKIDPAKRILITAHDAFSYFARAYDFKVISLQGISTASQAGTRDVLNIINFIVLHKIFTIFAETCTPSRNMQALIQGAQAQGFHVKLGNELFSDTLGSADTLTGTYLGMLRYNVESIISGLRLG
jgi:manganese/zinc/iron transport system substrate-binding protein